MDTSFLQHSTEDGIDTAERLCWLSVGGLLAATAVAKKSIVSLPLAAAGGYVLFRAVRNERPGCELAGRKLLPASVAVERSVTILKSAEELYRMWKNFAELPRFIANLESITPVTNGAAGRHHWKFRGPFGAALEWDTEIAAEHDGAFLSWRPSAGSAIASSGEIRFRDAGGDRGTEVTLQLSFSGSAVIGSVANVFGRGPEQMVREGLRRFKQWAETGEIATIEGQPEGPRSPMGKIARYLDPNPARRQARTVAAEPRTGTF